MNRTLLVMLVVGVALATSVAWLARVGGERGLQARASLPAPTGSGVARATAPADELRPELGPLRAPAGAPQPEPPAAVATREDPVSADSIEGRVVFPPGTPADEEVFVLAKTGRKSRGVRHRVRADGSFRASFPEPFGSGWFGLEANHLYLEKDRRYGGSTDTDPVVLEPRLGGRVVGRASLPEWCWSTLVERRRGLGAVLLQEKRDGDRDWRAPVRFPLEPGGVFHFDALPTDSTYRLVFSGPALPPPVEEFRLEAGRSTRRDLDLRIGVVLLGRVSDEQGAPLSASLLLQPTGPEVHTANLRIANAEADGTFEIHAAPGAYSLRASWPGLVDAILPLEGLVEGDCRRGLELRLALGATIEGRVQWPDGSPVASASLECAQPRAIEAARRAQGTYAPRSAADGTFRLTGLLPGQVSLSAEGERTDPTGTWKGYAACDVEAGARDVVLRLGPLCELRGLVRDDLGEPLSSFEVSTKRIVLREGKETQKHGPILRGRGGTFFADSLRPGVWELDVIAEGHGPASSRRVTLPLEEKLVIELRRSSAPR